MIVCVRGVLVYKGRVRGACVLVCVRGVLVCKGSVRGACVLVCVRCMCEGCACV